MTTVRIDNNGAEIVSTDYWLSEHARRGLLYLSGNAGVLRLLVPQAAHTMLAEMRTGKRVTIEKSISVHGHWDIVFEDGSSTPYAVTIDPRQIDRQLQPGRSRLAVWTESGRVLDLDCRIVLATP
jgi:hypothetical protein